MALVSWAKKELSKLKLQNKPKRLTLPQTSTKCLALPLVSHHQLSYEDFQLAIDLSHSL